MAESVTLRVSSLASKFGFGDGDVVSDYICDNDLEYVFDCDEHDILARLVEYHLLPLIPHVTCYRVGCIHNPIRCDAEFVDFCSSSEIAVAVTKSHVLAAIEWVGNNCQTL